MALKLGEKKEKEERGELKMEGEVVGRNRKGGKSSRRDKEIGGQKRGTREEEREEGASGQKRFRTVVKIPSS